MPVTKSRILGRLALALAMLLGMASAGRAIAAGGVEPERHGAPSAATAPAAAHALTPAQSDMAQRIEKTVAHAEENAKEEEPGLIGFQLNTAAWVLVIFLVLLAVLYKTAWKNVLAGLKAREQRIRNDLAAAAAERAKAEAEMKKYAAQIAGAEQKVRDMLAAATTDAERLAAQIHDQAQKEAEDLRQRAVQDIESAKKHAISEIYSEAATMATSIAEKILRRNLNPDDQRDLVRQSLEQMQQTGNGDANRN